MAVLAWCGCSGVTMCSIRQSHCNKHVQGAPVAHLPITPAEAMGPSDATPIKTFSFLRLPIDAIVSGSGLVMQQRVSTYNNVSNVLE